MDSNAVYQSRQYATPIRSEILEDGLVDQPLPTIIGNAEVVLASAGCYW
jgi:hypothetical protein